MPRHHAQNGSNGDHGQSDRSHYNNGHAPSRSRLNAKTKRKDQIDPIDIEIDQGKSSLLRFNFFWITFFFAFWCLADDINRNEYFS